MKIKSLLIVAFTAIFFSSFAQDPKEGYAIGKKILNLINQNKATELAEMVNYPLQRLSPVPDIKNEKEFVAYFPILFDAKFKKLIPKFSQKEVMARNGMFGMVGEVFNGEIWYDESGIYTVNYNSDKEMALEKALNDKTKTIIHPSLRDFETNILMLKSKNLELRIDYTKDGKCRYASWSKGKAISQKPDLILVGAQEISDGHPPYPFYVFKNKNWKYTVTEEFECEDCDMLDRMLILEENGVQKSRILMRISK
ncbi:hypothetical protein [Lacihabitans sp. CCS-44]|uniref:hypothetical protein n=1 Tax=Lacihabitans sp. CCS-44 TaxID=2487331 RepID=UPI0020CF1481|nr:hypothetical protein [Lacihabitans sp. CCS-44]